MLIIKKDILILSKGPTQGLGNTTLNAEAKDSFIFTDNGKKFRSNSYVIVNGVKI